MENPETLSVERGGGSLERVVRPHCISGGDWPGNRDDGLQWFSINLHWWDSPVVLGPVDGKPYGEMDVWAADADFAGAVAKAIRYMESLGHSVDRIIPNV